MFAEACNSSFLRESLTQHLFTAQVSMDTTSVFAATRATATNTRRTRRVWHYSHTFLAGTHAFGRVVDKRSVEARRLWVQRQHQLQPKQNALSLHTSHSLSPQVSNPLPTCGMVCAPSATRTRTLSLNTSVQSSPPPAGNAPPPAAAWSVDKAPTLPGSTEFTQSLRL